MFNILLGVVVFLGAGLTLWLLMPRGGKPSPIAGSNYEAYCVVGLVAIIGLGIGLFIEGATIVSR